MTLDKIEKSVEKISTTPLTPEEYCVKAGIDLNKIYKELGDIATSAVIVAKDRDGDRIELGADNKTRLAAIALILELNKHIKDKQVITNVGIFNDPNVLADAQRVLALRGTTHGA